jgi:hypothetical protein
LLKILVEQIMEGSRKSIGLDVDTKDS